MFGATRFARAVCDRDEEQIRHALRYALIVIRFARGTGDEDVRMPRKIPCSYNNGSSDDEAKPSSVDHSAAIGFVFISVHSRETRLGRPERDSFLSKSWLPSLPSVQSIGSRHGALSDRALPQIGTPARPGGTGR
jgi:hypothetical protein